MLKHVKVLRVLMALWGVWLLSGCATTVALDNAIASSEALREYAALSPFSMRNRLGGALAQRIRAIPTRAADARVARHLADAAEWADTRPEIARQAEQAAQQVWRSSRPLRPVGKWIGGQMADGDAGPVGRMMGRELGGLFYDALASGAAQAASRRVQGPSDVWAAGLAVDEAELFRRAHLEVPPGLFECQRLFAQRADAYLLRPSTNAPRPRLWRAQVSVRF